MKIKTKADIEKFIQRFDDFSQRDDTKLYLTVKDTKHDGTITIMKYDNNVFTYHRKNESFWDIKEQIIESKDLYKLIWKNRKSINKFLKAN
ncbi:hypothetical protein [Metabacillus sediminilitoris]|uniref:Uncharacterized protein n=1 Tax=Metabacillus sediminilitoris TaxID=2567941 RepID=A0A4S4BJM4_9BACI|nr:hypothetical protein [Metabacillus sediminilitoris]QGQ46371.1 hypothetical protein GMB29_14790 [Metabacillus sediminilitoris]THF73898.1 hypothetical protein E6W99_25975 [Metabacillus sediminilitoris]